MAIAAMAAPPMASASFQSSNKTINDKTPFTKSRGLLGTQTGRQRRGGQTATVTQGATPAYSSENWGTGESVLRGLHRIAQYANPGNSDFYAVTSGQRADARGGAGSDDVAGKKRHHAGNPADEKRHRINHQRGFAGLAQRAVDVRLDMEAGRIEVRFDVRTDRTKSVEAFAAGKLHVALLQIARGDVVE